MPQVPRYEQQTVGLNPIATPQARPLGAAAFGAGIGQGLQEVAGDLQKVAAITQRANEIETAKRDKAIHDGAAAKTIEMYDELTIAAKQVKGIGVQKDRDEDGNVQPGAPDLVEQYSGEFNDRIQKITEGMTPDQLTEFQPVMERYRLGLKKQLMEHAVNETEQYQKNQTKGLYDLQVKAWAQAPDGAEETARQDVIGTLSTMYSGDELKAEEQKITQAVNYQRATDAILRDPLAAKSVVEKYAGSLTEEHKTKLADLGRYRVNVITAEKHDAVFQESILPALTNKTFIPPLTANAQYKELSALDPAKAVSVAKDAEQFNAGLAVDNFDVYMTGVPEARRSTLTMAQLPENISTDLKTHAPAVYNRLAEKFDAERVLRQGRAAAEKANKGSASALVLQSFINPDKINQNEVVRLVQSGQIDPKLGLAILDKAQKGADVRGKLKQEQYALTIDDEATYMASGVKEKDRKAAKERILSTIYDAMIPMFNSTTEVTPEAVQSLLTRMRRTTVEEIGRGQVYALGVTPSTNVRIPKAFQAKAEELAKLRGITPGQAWGIMQATHNLGQSFDLIKRQGGVK